MPLFAIAAAIASAAKWVFTATSGWAVAAKTAILMAGSYFVNRALTPSIRSRTEPTSHPFGAQTTEEQGGPIQVVYGSTRAHANIVGHYLDLPAQSGVEKNSTIGRHILACFGEGPWAAEPEEATIRLNGRPMSDFPDLTCQWTLGRVDQAALTAWSAFRQDYWVGQSCLYNEAVTYTMTRTGFDEISVILHWPKGLIHYGTEGDIHHEELKVKVEFGDAIADTWQTVYEATIAGKTSQPAWKRIHASGSWTGGTAFHVTPAMQPRARVTLRTTVSTNSRHIRDVEFAAVQVTKNVGFTHPGMVLLDLGTVPNEVLSGGLTELSVETTGKVVADEEGAFAVSRTHADAVRDILTQPVIEGDGDADPWSASYYRGVADASLVGGGWAAQKTLADTPVPDGLGNNVDMLRFDAVFSGSTSVHNAIGQVGASGRCGLQCIGNAFGLWVDEPRTPVGLLCDGNWERDSFHLDPIAADDLAGEASVRYRDADAGYAERSVLVIDHEMDSLTTVDIDLIGTSRTHEAARLARRELARNRLVDLSAECRADIDAVVYEAGDVVYCQIDGRSIGGRVTAATATTITVNRPVTDVVTGSDVVIVQRRDAVSGEQELDIQAVVSVSDDGRTITVSGWDTTPTGDGSESFLFGPEAMEDEDQFEVIESRLDQDLHVGLSLVKYVPALDDLDALAPDAYVPLSALGRVDHYGGVNRRDLGAGTIDRIGTRGDVICEWGCYTFAANDPGAGSIRWATQQDDDGDDSGYVRYGANLYQPADGDTAKAYVYWDPDDPNVFSTTDDFADVVGKFLVAINSGGTPITGFAFIPVDATSALWANITGPGKPEDGATVGAAWGENIVGQPFDMQNLVKKPTFEDGNKGTWASSGPVSVVDVEGQAWKKALQIESRHTIEYLGSSVDYPTCTPGETFYLEADVNTEDSPHKFILYARFLNAAKDYTQWVAADELAAGQGWTKLKGVVTTPANRRYVQVDLSTNALSDFGAIQVTNIRLSRYNPDADVTADHQGDINFDNIQDGSSYKKLSAEKLTALESAINMDTPQPLSGWEGAFTNNSPSAGYVAWTGFTVRYQGTNYAVSASSADEKYLYWNAGAIKTQLYASDTFADALGTGKFIVGYNDAGTFYPAQFVKVLHGALIQAATILADHLSVATLSAITANLGTVTSGTITLSLGGDTRLRIDSNGLYVSDDAGSTWSEVIYNNAGVVALKADIVEAGTIVTSHLAAEAVNIERSEETAGETVVNDHASSFTTVETLSNFPSAGGIIRVEASVDLRSNTGTPTNAYVQVSRGGSPVWGPRTYIIQANTGDWTPVEASFWETPGSGNRTYTLQVRTDSQEGKARYRKILATEAKR